MPSGPWLRLREKLSFWVILVFALASFGGCSVEPFGFEAEGPFPYASATSGALERVAVIVTITNLSGDDLQVSPADFVARDASRRVYPAAAAGAAGRSVGSVNKRGTMPLPAMTLRGGDVLSGFALFDVPAGVRPVEVVWRQADRDYVANLNAPR